MTAAVNWEFSVSINHTGDDRYYLKVENVPTGGILAEAQVSWAVEDWLDRTRQLMNDPLHDILQGRDVGARENLAHPDAKFAPNFVDLGQELYDALFQGTIRDSWLMAQAIAQHYRSVLRLRIGLRGSTLPRLPWEVMHYWNCPLAATTDITFSRYQILSRAIVSPRNSRSGSTTPLRILMVIAAPNDQESLELCQEAEHLRAELKERHGSPLLDLTILEQPGREELTYALEHGNYHIFHYSGHSNLGANGGNLFLVNNQNGLTETLNGNDLAGLLSNNGVQLVVFNSCRGAYTAASEETSTTGNLTQSLINRGIPAVLAMSERIPDNVAVTMTRLFYRNLNQGYPIDLSLSRARQGLISTYGSNQLYWALPVLYLHPEFDGSLWKAPMPQGNLQQLWDLPQEELSFPHPAGLSLNLSSPGDSSSSSSGSLGKVGVNPLDYLVNNELDSDSGNLSNFSNFSNFSSPSDQLLDLEGLDDSDRPLISSEEMNNFFRNSKETVAFEQPKKQANGDKSDKSDHKQSKDQKSVQKSGKTASLLSRKTNKTPLPVVPLVTRSPQTLSNSAKAQKTPRGLGMAWLSTCILLGTIVGASGWWYSQQQPSLETVKTPSPLLTPSSNPVNLSNPVPSPSPVPQNIDVKTADVNTLIGLGSKHFQDGDLIAGRLVVEELLDRKALKEAKTTLEAVNLAQTEDPNLNFLRGRLAWQFIKAGNKDYTLENVQKFWDSASKNQPDSVFYYNALGFSYYEAGDYSKAKDAWFAALKIIEVNPGMATPSVPSLPATPVDFRDRLNTSAGLALVFHQLSDNLLRTERNRLRVESQNFYQQVIKDDGVNYQPEILAKNWLWTEKAVRDWKNLGN